MLRMLSIGALVSLSLACAGCGGSSQPQLVSIKVAPASTLGLSVQLIATGTYVNGKQVTPLAVTWTNYDPSMTPPPLAAGWPTINSSGLAQCGPLPATATFWGSTTVKSRLIFGTAQLICP
jgi:hypothetical protein